MRRSPSTFFDGAEAAASNRPEAQINIPDIFDNSTILPQRQLFCSQVIAVSLTFLVMFVLDSYSTESLRSNLILWRD